MKVSIVIGPSSSGGHVARCPSLPGCVVDADTEEKAAQKMRSAVMTYLASLDVPVPATVELAVSRTGIRMANAGIDMDRTKITRRKSHGAARSQSW